MTPGPAICLSGPPGAGKSTLARAVVARTGWGHVDFDAHERMTRWPAARLEDWLARGAPFAEAEAPGFAEAVAVARARGPVVVEAPLGRADPRAGGLFDLALWLDCPPELALSRQLRAMLAAEPPPAAAWLTGFLAQYENFVRPLLRLQQARVQPLADRALDACGSVPRLVGEILQEAQSVVTLRP